MPAVFWLPFCYYNRMRITVRGSARGSDYGSARGIPRHAKECRVLTIFRGTCHGFMLTVRSAAMSTANPTARPEASTAARPATSPAARIGERPAATRGKHRSKTRGNHHGNGRCKCCGKTRHKSRGNTRGKIRGRHRGKTRGNLLRQAPRLYLWKDPCQDPQRDSQKTRGWHLVSVSYFDRPVEPSQLAPRSNPQCAEN